MNRPSLEMFSLARAWASFRDMPTTQVRISVTVLIWFLVGWSEIMVFLWKGVWQPIPPSFAGLLAVMAGLDGLQFFGKRTTHDRYQENCEHDDPETDEE